MNPDIFREYDIRGIVGEDLTEATVRRISQGIALYFAEKRARRIVVGFDARESSPLFQQILIDALRRNGCEVSDLGRVPTPVLYFALYDRNFDGAVMITGSHNPANHNGFKISLGRNSLYGAQIQEVKSFVVSEKAAAFDSAESVSAADAQLKNDSHTSNSHTSNAGQNMLADYQNYLARRIQLGSRHLKVVVDAGNGMGGVTAVPFYERLGVETVTLFCEPDSSFPNHEPDPSQEDNLQALIARVLETKADLGIAFDGDADRIAVVDETGRIIRGDELMILFAHEVLRHHPASTVIAEVKCTQVLFDEITCLGGTALMTPAGHSLIKAKMRETGAILAGEMSGHIFFADNFYGFDDACYAGARLLEILSRTDQTLSAVFARFPQMYATPEIRIPCPESKKKIVLAEIVEEFSKNHPVNTIDGARITFDNGWGLVRPSNTQALFILRAEAIDQALLQNIETLLRERLSESINKSAQKS